MRAAIRASGVAAVCVWAAWASAGEPAAPGFAKKPAAAKAGDKLEVSFAVSAPTDVEVAVLAADGKIVRHLAAGVLGGEKAPPEPLKPGLAQNVAWDGRDDTGKPAGGGPFRFRVRLGMTVKYGRIFGTSPYTGDMAWYGWTGLATDADGSLYVKMTSATLFPCVSALAHLNIFHGCMRDVRLYSRALEEREIETLALCSGGGNSA